MKQKKQWKSRAGRGLSPSELIQQMDFAGTDCGIPERRMELMCSLKNCAWKDWTKSCTTDLRVRGPHSSSHAKCSSIGDIPAPCCKSTALRPASIQKSRETRSSLRLAISGPLQVPFQDVVHSTLTGTDTLQNMKNLDAHSEMRSLLQK